MIYIWKCRNCGKELEVEAKVDDRDVSPGQCSCSGELQRIIAKSTFILSGQGWAKDNYSKPTEGNM